MSFVTKMHIFNSPVSVLSSLLSRSSTDKTINNKEILLDEGVVRGDVSRRPYHLGPFYRLHKHVFSPFLTLHVNHLMNPITISHSKCSENTIILIVISKIFEVNYQCLCYLYYYYRNPTQIVELSFSTQKKNRLNSHISYVE